MRIDTVCLYYSIKIPVGNVSLATPSNAAMTVPESRRNAPFALCERASDFFGIHF